MLTVKGLHVHYGAIHAIHGVDLEIFSGEIVTILGSNGAGKSTILRSISGLTSPSAGTILFQKQKLNGLKANRIVKLGISQAPEGRLIFPEHTVLENLEIGAYLRRDREEICQDFEYVYHLFPKLKDRSKQPAGTLSGGEQQMLAIGRALMAKPKLLLLDEPSLGLAPILVGTIFKAIEEVNRRGTTILLVEQNAFAALKVAHRGYVLTTGAVTLTGSGDELISNDQVKNAYLGA
ncbi:MAG: ABC transporter ATP-binding protein [Bdellovibrionales bacterium]|nr:ABC transporter ATP-binding protein [Bdellovibrionales bacterium]MBT3525129.1 ABC transporter ATP-binding protein [Bdellovibrionales bacterium]MBT7670487.1 ABC transporter ATP-binding protein [Bdellovibrionales bacterium]MBT7766521.1 ABC transporter ATP-binding protein [Bdellovibrionales bacterium]